MLLLVAGSWPDPGHSVNPTLSNSLQEMAVGEAGGEGGPVGGHDCPPVIPCSAGGPPGSAGLTGGEGSQRRRRASMQDAIDFTKFNASLYERPVRRATAE